MKSDYENMSMFSFVYYMFIICLYYTDKQFQNYNNYIIINRLVFN